MKGLAPKTLSVFNKICLLDCIKPYTLVGGTALSLQIANRLSEDLDFMSWKLSKDEKREVDWPEIKKQLESIGTVEKIDILDFSHVEFIVDGVKISFYANPNYSPVQIRIPIKENVYAADKVAIGAMKMEVLMRRSQFRDYYDIYSLLEDNVSLKEMMEKALKYSGHRLKTKNLIAMLTRSDRFEKESSFEMLNPRYDISPIDIEQKIQNELKQQI